MNFVAECRTTSAPSLDRTLAQRRRECRVDDRQRASSLRSRGDGRDVCDHERRVRDRFDPHHVSAVRCRHHGIGVVGAYELDAEAAGRLQTLEDHPARRE